MDSVFGMYLFFWLVVFGGVGYLIGNAKGRPTAGALLGLLVGPIGWLVVAVGPNNQPKCPECGGVVVEGARKCKNCGSDLGHEPEIAAIDSLDIDGTKSPFGSK